MKSWQLPGEARFAWPPTWPNPPKPGWRPPLAWEPDESWPPPPEGWIFWQDWRGRPASAASPFSYGVLPTQARLAMAGKRFSRTDALARCVMVALLLGGVGYGFANWVRSNGPGTPWQTAQSVTAQVTKCGGDLDSLGDLNGELTITLNNPGPDRVEGKARVVVVAGTTHVDRSIRTTLDPGQSGTFDLGYVLTPSADARSFSCQLETPLEERPAGNEDKDPQDDRTCWGDPSTGRIAETFDEYSVPSCSVVHIS